MDIHILQLRVKKNIKDLCISTRLKLFNKVTVKSVIGIIREFDEFVGSTTYYMGR